METVMDCVVGGGGYRRSLVSVSACYVVSTHSASVRAFSVVAWSNCMELTANYCYNTIQYSFIAVADRPLGK